MSVASYALPFGLRQVKLVPINPATGAEVTANAVLLPTSRTFSFSETEDFTTLEGGDRRVASHGAGPIVEWDLEGGGISLEVWKVLSGATIATSGGTGAEVKTLTKLVSAARPSFNAYGRAVSDSGGDFQMVVYNCKADSSLEASMENGAFLLTSCSGTGIGQDTGNASTDKLYEFLHRETAVPLADPSVGTNWSLTITGTPAGGNFKLAVGAGETATIAHNAASSTIASALNAVPGISGATVSGTTPGPFAITFTSAVALRLRDNTLSGGTNPGVTITNTTP